MSTPSPLDEDLTPERLTETLHASGGLDGGHVVGVAVESSRTTLVSTIQRLRLRYAGGDGPATLIRGHRHDEDYRWSALWQITTPVWQSSVRLHPAVWWSHLERAMLTVDDLDCRALLG